MSREKIPFSTFLKNQYSLLLAINYKGLHSDDRLRTLTMLQISRVTMLASATHDMSTSPEALHYFNTCVKQKELLQTYYIRFTLPIDFKEIIFYNRSGMPFNQKMQSEQSRQGFFKSENSLSVEFNDKEISERMNILKREKAISFFKCMRLEQENIELKRQIESLQKLLELKNNSAPQNENDVFNFLSQNSSGNLFNF